ncbi:hypothetical protein H9L39_06073 [Fusarium oxysporum f. sp. albedinis]|nr:hypothetical protein H9L39_06073 [Fusarium oxysporum f. sp. albedinis]
MSDQIPSQSHFNQCITTEKGEPAYEGDCFAAHYQVYLPVSLEPGTYQHPSAVDAQNISSESYQSFLNNTVLSSDHLKLGAVRHDTRVGNNIYPYDLTQGEYAVLTNGVSHSISNSNEHSGQSTDTGLGYQHNENTGISYDHVLKVLEAPKSSKFWCKRTSNGPQCTICGQKCSREDNLKRHVRSRVCEKEWNRKTWIEQWIILEGMAVNA